MKFLLVTLTLIVLGLQYRFWVGDGSLAHVVRLNDDIERQQAENDRLKERNRLLAAEVEALKSGTEGIEERARHQMGMIREGETFFLIVNESP
ncbi:cell division protein FtsB [Agarilytica rhodophyticola]|uniref:cell division protein FtsB n=1 Tax=Agarilytica rhodophyticola TaxID=1737490 RepID=UPI000B3480BD|nr:cell division protein FtsB [Agarilytica rhodophyticola]